MLVCLVGVGLLKFGPLLLILGFIGGAAWLGRDTSRKGADPESKGHIGRLQSIYNGLVPYLQNGDDPDQHFTPGGGYRDAFTAWEFDEQDRLIRLRMDYSEYFRDGEAESRAKVERALEGKIGHANEYLYAWDEEGNHLDVRILPPLPEGIGAQPWPVADIEFVLGITDPGSAGRLIPVMVPDPEFAEDTLTPEVAARESEDGVPPGFRLAQLAPVVWRVGNPSASPHLLVAGGPASGKSTRRCVHCWPRRWRAATGSRSSTPTRAPSTARWWPANVCASPRNRPTRSTCDWFGPEIERRAESSTRQQTAGQQAGEPPLWLFVDDLPELCAAAGRLGRPDPQDTLATLARKARYAGTTIVVTARLDQVAALRLALRNQLASRIALGKVDGATSTLLFGGTLELGGAQLMPPGRGYVRVGAGPVIRLQTPYSPALVPSSV